MNKFYRFYVAIGHLLFWLLLPLQRLLIRRTKRAYALIIDGNKALLVKNWVSDGKWALPGGGVRGNESSKQALVRELGEEINITSNINLGHLLKDNWQGHGFGFSYDLFISKGKPDFNTKRKLEITDAAWVEINSLDPSNTAIDILKALNMISSNS